MPPQQPLIEYDRLPKVVRIGNFGIALSVAGLVGGGGIVEIFFPELKGNGIPKQMWPVLVAIWAPGLVGLLLGFYSIVRYPYLSIATGGGQSIISSRTWIWKFLGGICYVLGPLMMLSAFANYETLWELVIFAYVSLLILFAGFLMATYCKNKHVTIATFLELTFGFGVIVYPLYLPA